MNVKNELTNAVGLASSYDVNGNLTNRVYDATGPKSYTYVYNDENQLTEMRTDTVNTPSGSRWRTLWVYDGLGRARVRAEYTWSGTAWVLAEAVRYVFDGMRVIQERNVSNTPTVVYTRGSDLSGSLEGAGGIGGLLGRSHGWYSGGNYTTHNHYHADGNGNVTYLVNASQTSEAVYRYDPYGRTMSQSGSLATANRYRFSSKEIHSQSGMYYYGFRFYDPHLQRWSNRDPLGDTGSVAAVWNRGLRARGNIELWDGPSLYGFVYGNPVLWVDAHGLYTWQEWLEIIGDGAIGAGEGFAAELDGALPGNPFAGWGFYDPCAPWVKSSRAAGAFARDRFMDAAGVGIAQNIMRGAKLGKAWDAASKGEQYFFGTGWPSALLNGYGHLGKAAGLGWGGLGAWSKVDSVGHLVRLPGEFWN